MLAKHRSRLLVWGALAVGLIGFAPFVPVDHDESQYLAAAALTLHGLPFVDFPYLQTPLQPFVTAPVAFLFSGYSFIALRIVTALAALATLWFVFACQRRLGVSERTALAATVLMALTHSFLFGATVVRNDMLPALLLAGGLYAALTAMSGQRRLLLWGVAGAAFGAAVGTKISYALPAAAVGIFHALTVWRQRDRASTVEAAACAVGALISFVPVAILFAQAPAAFIYGVFDFANQGPFYWYQLKGDGHRLGLDWKLIDTVVVLIRGPAWLALAVVAMAIVKRIRRDGPHFLLDLLVIGGLIAAVLPTPTWKQYLIPLLPPLFVRLGLAWHEGAVAQRWRRAVIGAFAFTALVGLAEPVRWVARISGGKPNSITMTREAHWIGTAVAQGEIATVSPQVAIDSGIALDPRFAGGPFAYRSGDLWSDEQQRALHIISPRTLNRFLAARPPAAIVTGYESKPTRNNMSLDDDLRAFAVAHGYRLERSPFGKAELFVRPRH